MSDASEAVSLLLRETRASLPRGRTGAAIAERLADLATGQPHDAARRCADLLLRFGFRTEAARLYQGLAENFPQRPNGATGLAQIATQQQNWRLARDLWQAVIDAHPAPPNPSWAANVARARDELAGGGLATPHLDALMEADPQLPFALASRAQSALLHQRRPDALRDYDLLLATFPDHDAAPHWRISRTGALADANEAATAAAAILHGDPWMHWALHALMHARLAMGRHEDALAAWQSSLFADADLPAFFDIRRRILELLRRYDEARHLFQSHLGHATDVDALERLFTAAPRLHEGWDLAEIRRDLTDRLDRLPPPVGDATAETAARNVLHARLKLALADHAGFRRAAAVIAASVPTEQAVVARQIAQIGAVAATLAEQGVPDFGAPKIFGIGLARTGTTSLGQALEHLGYRTLHWTNPLTGALISEADLPLFDAFTDTSLCPCFEKYYYLFENAKFIYTTRPAADWVQSFTRHWQSRHPQPDFDHARRLFRDCADFPFGRAYREIFSALYFNHPTAEIAHRTYDRRVRGFFASKPSDRFLVLDLTEGDGWPELCRFLGKDVPDAPFPFENKAST